MFMKRNTARFEPLSTDQKQNLVKLLQYLTFKTKIEIIIKTRTDIEFHA